MSFRGDRMEKRRKALKLSQEDLANMIGVSQQAITQWENGETRRPKKLNELAKCLNVAPEYLLDQTSKMKPVSVATQIPIVGYVGAGAEAYFYDDHEQGGGLDMVEAPPDTPENAIAVMIRGESMEPAYFDEDILFYDTLSTDFDAFLNHRPCVCRLADGRTMIKTPNRGSEDGLYTLTSFNAKDIKDVALDWCAKIEWVKKR